MYINKQGTLANATPVAVAVAPGEPPFTATLTSSDGGRKIEYSTDGGTVYVNPTPSITAATQLILNVAYPITNIRFTGAAAGGDKYSIQ